MLVSRDKYNAAVTERDELQSSVDTLKTDLAENKEALAKALESNDAMQAQLDELNARDLQKEISQLKEDLNVANQQSAETVSKLEASIATLKEENGNLKKDKEALSADISTRDERIGELEQTIERLNNSGGETTAAAASENDDPSNRSSLNDFCEENAEDTSACLRRLREEGF